MKPCYTMVVALFLLGTCNDKAGDTTQRRFESVKLALGTIPASETAVWKQVGFSKTPEARYLHAAAFDIAREVLVLFGGTEFDPNNGTATPNQETWEWNTTTGTWTNRTVAGAGPEARSGAAMAYDSARKKIVLFGGRAGSGFNYEDTWEWDPVTGIWTQITQAGSHPSARSQHAMVYESSTGKILLFGGGRSDFSSYDATGITLSMGDTWELDPNTQIWKQQSPVSTPSPRHDLGLAWDVNRQMAVLFGGLQADLTGASGIPKQDTWEWDPKSANWTERTSTGIRPGPRYAHAMAFDSSRGRMVVFGGFDMLTGGNLNDVWDWDPASGVWSKSINGDEGGMPGPRRYANFISDNKRKRLELVFGLTTYNPYPMTGGSVSSIMPPGIFVSSASKEIWELDPMIPSFTNRSSRSDVPPARTGQAMAYYPPTGKVYIFGGSEPGAPRYLNDLWSWDGKNWEQITGSMAPAARTQAGMAYDPSRKALILYGGSSNQGLTNETWEWTDGHGWKELIPVSSPEPFYGVSMVTDTSRSKVLLLGGSNGIIKVPFLDYPMDPIYPQSIGNFIWEWDGKAMTWTNRTSLSSNNGPLPRSQPFITYDDVQQKLLFYDGNNYLQKGIWLWDPMSAGWAQQSTGDLSGLWYPSVIGYDSIRKRHIFLSSGTELPLGQTVTETLEFDLKSSTWFVRKVESPAALYASTMVFDSGRGVMVLFRSSNSSSLTASNETWELSVAGVENGTGCALAFASSCASGHCVDGVCCESASCTGPCKSCNVSGKEGTCVAAKAGTEVLGSCSNGQACDGNGNCMASNGQTCTSGSQCASGFCVDGVCCNEACGGACKACNQTGRIGTCSSFVAGTDPENECGKGEGLCKATCDGVNGCAFPQQQVVCANCLRCDGFGSCSLPDPYCKEPFSMGGSIAGTGGAGGMIPPTGGIIFPTAGSPSKGGSIAGLGGMIFPTGGTTGGIPSMQGGAAGSPYNRGGAGGVSGTGGKPGTGGGLATGGSVSGRGGSGGNVVRTGGNMGQGGSRQTTGGSGGKVDARPIGSGGSRDGASYAPLDPSLNSRFHHSGCSCKIGQPVDTRSKGTLPLFAVGLSFMLLRFRQHRK